MTGRTSRAARLLCELSLGGVVAFQGGPAVAATETDASSQRLERAIATTPTTTPGRSMQVPLALPIGEPVCGDVNCNTGVQASDALRILRVAVGQPVVLTCSSECDQHTDETTPRFLPPVACADVNCDDQVTASDALATLRIAVGQPLSVSCGFDCHASSCGDGEVCDEGWNCISGPGGGGEQCDDGNSAEDDACTNQCVLVYTPCTDFFDDPSPDPPARDVTSDAGEDREVLRGALVPVEGSATAPDGAEVELCWTIESRPPGSAAELDDRGAADPSFYADEPGDYVLVLRAAAGEVVSHPARITISARTVRTEVEAAETERLVSADHALVMDVPAGAMEEDAELSIQLRLEEELPEELADAEPVAAYEFGPDGAQFDPTLALSWRGASDPDDALIVPVGVDGEDFADADEALIHLSADGIEAEWETGHFSGAALLRLKTISLKVDGPLLAGVGHRFEIAYLASSATGPVGLSVITSRHGAFATAPQLLAPLPAQPVVDDLRYDQDLDLLFPARPESKGLVSGRCVAPGVVRVAFEVEVSALALRALLPSGTFNRDPVVQLSAVVRCVGSALPPVAVDDSVSISFATGGLVLSPLGNDFDPDGQLDPASIEILQAPARGSAVANADGTVTVTLGGRLRLVDSVRYRVSDMEGFVSNPATVFLKRFDLPNVPPTLTGDAFVVGRNTPADLAVLANDSDADGVLDPATVQVTQIAQHGSAVVNPDGSVLYTPTLDYVGSDSFRYQAADDRGTVAASVLVDLQVVATGPAPAVADDSAGTLEEVPVDIDVLANDSGDIDANSLELTVDPAHGSVDIVQGAFGDPVLRYTPEPGFLGSDLFHYRVANNDGLFSAAALVQVFVSDPDNLSPVAGDDEATTPRNVAVDIFVALNDEDPDGLLSLGSEFIVAPPLHGTAVAFGAGTFRYTPEADFVGIDTFTYRIADAQNAVSNVALVTIEVFDPPNSAPTAGDDTYVVAPDVTTLLPVLLDDSDIDGTLDPTSVSITAAPTSGSAVAEADGRISYTPMAGFLGDDSFSYRVADDDGALSNVATVEIQVRDFAGVDGNPVDNISAAQVHFFASFGSGFISQGVGGFFGFNHADDAALATLTPISDYTWWFEGNPDSGDAGVAAAFSMETDLQTGVATYDAMSKIHAITGFQASPLYPDEGGEFAVEPVGGGTRSTVPAPPTLLDAQGDPTIFRGPFDRFRTEVQFPDGEFTHLLLRAIEFRPPSTLRGVLMRVPADAMELDNVTGMRHRPILDELAAATLEAAGFEPTGGIAVVFYNQVDNSSYFTGPGKRAVPLAAGRGVSLPAAQMVAPGQSCANIATGVECEGGPREVLMAVNQNGSVTMHSPDDGSFLDSFLGGNAPNFTIGSGWHLVQDPSTNCLLFSDSDNRKIAKYDTDASLLSGTFITAAGGASTLFTPRGMAFRNGELLVTDSALGRVLRFNSAGTFLGELATGLGVPNGVFVAGNGDVIYSDESGSGTNDAIRLIPADGQAVRGVILGGLSTPYQISRLFDGNLAVANFGLNQIRLFEDGFPNIANVVVGTSPINSNNMNPRGIWPLRDGNWLATLSNGGGVAVLDPDQGATAYVNTEAAGSTYRFLSRVCLPQ